MRLAELFGIAPGTQRTALSRMVAAGELRRRSEEGYGLARAAARAQVGAGHRAHQPVDRLGRLVVDRRRHGTGPRRRRAPGVPHRDGQRPPGRAARRHVAAPGQHRRPGRPGDTVVDRGPLAGADRAELTDRLWDLGARPTVRGAELARRLARRGAGSPLDGARGPAPRPTLLAADAVRFLREEPYLPPQLRAAATGRSTGSVAPYRAFDRDLRPGRCGKRSAPDRTSPSTGRPPSDTRHSGDSGTR